jgi:hypothetical protein
LSENPATPLPTSVVTDAAVADPIKSGKMQNNDLASFPMVTLISSNSSEDQF